MDIKKILSVKAFLYSIYLTMKFQKRITIETILLA